MMYLEILRVWIYNLFLGQCKFDAEYNAKIGEWLNEDRELVVKASGLTSKFNGLVIWTGNYPYSYGHPWDRRGPLLNGKEYGLSATNIVKLEMKVRNIKQERERARRSESKSQLKAKLEELS